MEAEVSEIARSGAQQSRILHPHPHTQWGAYLHDSTVSQAQPGMALECLATGFGARLHNGHGVAFITRSHNVLIILHTKLHSRLRNGGSHWSRGACIDRTRRRGSSLSYSSRASGYVRYQRHHVLCSGYVDAGKVGRLAVAPGRLAASAAAKDSRRRSGRM